jgi:hypothetical protein
VPRPFLLSDNVLVLVAVAPELVRAPKSASPSGRDLLIGATPALASATVRWFSSAAFRVAAIRAEIIAIQIELDDLAERVGRGEISAALAARAEPGILARLRDAEQREQATATPTALADLLHPSKDLAARWRATPTAARREAFPLVFAPGLVGYLCVTRSPSPGHRVPIADRVEWRDTLPTQASDHTM